MLLIFPSGKIRKLDALEKGWGLPSFRNYNSIKYAIKGEFSIIRLSDGRRLVILKDQRKQQPNMEATNLLRKYSWQSEAIVCGVAVICSMKELGRIEYKSKFTPEARKALSEHMKLNHRYSKEKSDG
jgi:hypothetical protein